MPSPPERRVVVVGSVNLDLVAYAPRFPRPGETISGATFTAHPGGKGANQALAAHRLGAEAALVASVGRDDHAAIALATLRAEGVDLGAVVAGLQPTGVALIVVVDGENEIVVAPGANMELVPAQVEAAVATARTVICQLEIPTDAVEAAAAAAPGLFCLNAAPVQPVSAGVLERSDLVVVNEHEHAALPGLDRLPLVALTLGSAGAVLLEHGREIARAAPPRVEAVDSTGAGDAFTACLAVSLAEGMPRDDSLRRACVAGALAASRAGAQPSMPTRADVDRLAR